MRLNSSTRTLAPFALASVGFVAALTLSAAAQAQTPSPKPSINPTPKPSPSASPKPSGGLVGQCRAAKQDISVFTTASASSKVVKSLRKNDAVTLAANVGENGFIAISAPAGGFVQLVNLKLCGGTTPPVVTSPPATGKALCRQVVTAKPVVEAGGLVVRTTPGTGAVVAGVAPGSQVTLTTNPATTQPTSDGRVWVEISGPVKGWISNGFQNGVSNLVLCP
jgi:hypothetical protein